jgi:glucokinase
MQKPLVAGIDIGGTNTVFGLVTDKGNILVKDSLPTDQFPEIADLVNEVASRIKKFLIQYPEYTLTGCGIGAPNGNYFTGNIEYAPNLLWKGIVPLKAMVEKVLGVKTIITNDANAAAMGEMLYGAAKGFTDFIEITLGTGLGSGIVSNGKLLYGHDGFAGELGHVIIQRDGRPCSCGRNGCLEMYCSAKGIIATYKEVANSDVPITAKEIFERAKAYEENAIKAFELTGEWLGLALANAVAVTSPQAFVLFGGLAHSGELLLKPTLQSFNKNLHNIYRHKVQILVSTVNENDGAILGAASLIFNEHE